MGNNKVLIIAYYWPPSGGSGVQRWLKFVKYLPQFGWTPYVFTPENPSFAIKDESLLKDVPPEANVIRFPIWEPYDAFVKLANLFGKKKSAKPTDLVSTEKRSAFQAVSTWLRGNFFIPDPRIFWVKPSAKFLDKFIRENNIETIVTTGPPHSMHLIGLRLKKNNPSLKWLADFRDPWSEWGLLDSLMVGSMARGFHRRLEKKVLLAADKVITITPFYVKHFEGLSGRKVELLTNGFDEDDFKSIEHISPAKFTIRHVGIINEKCDPRPFMEALKQLIDERKELAHNTTIEFVGDVHPQFQTYIHSSPELMAITKFTGNIPHKKLLTTYGEASVLLLILTGYKDAEGYMPGKLFEYLAVGLPVIGTGPIHGDAAQLLKETQAGVMIDSNDMEGMKRIILENYLHWKNSDQSVRKMQTGKYSRKEGTARLVKVLEEISL